MKPVELTLRAINDLQNIRNFTERLLGRSKTEEIVEAIFKRIEILENPSYDFTQVGSIDEDFRHLKSVYRKLIQSHFKITYREGKTKIYVVRILDTRPNPLKNK